MYRHSIPPNCCQTLLILRDINKANPDRMERISDELWKQIVVEIDNCFFRFTKKIVDKYEYLLEEDIHFCCLVKLGFKYSDIAIPLACERDTAYKRKYSILHKMKLGKDVNLERILEELE